MPLSDEEQKILREIEAQLNATDPALVEQVSKTTLYRHSARVIRWAALGLLAGLVLLVFTFASNTLGTAAGLAVMKILASGGYESRVIQKGAYFLAKLRKLRKVHPEIGDIDGLGLALRMEMCHPDGIAPWRELADRMFQIGLAGDLQIRGTKMGLVLDIGGYHKNVITLAPARFSRSRWSKQPRTFWRKSARLNPVRSLAPIPSFASLGAVAWAGCTWPTTDGLGGWWR